jgi:hypothetical protein
MLVNSIRSDANPNVMLHRNSPHGGAGAGLAESRWPALGRREREVCCLVK